MRLRQEGWLRRWLYAHEEVPGEPRLLERRLQEQVRELLRRATGTTEREEAGDGSFVLHLGSEAPFGAWIRTWTGVASHSGNHLRIPVRWHADPGRHAFAQFDGVLELEPLSDRLAQLALVGHYRPPLGMVGVALDAAGMHRLADRTSHRLVRALAHELATDALGEPGVTGGTGARGRVAEGAAPGPGVGEPLRVADVMSPEPLLLNDTLPLRTAALLLLHYDLGGAPVVADSGELVGVLTDADLVAKEALTTPGIIGRRARHAERCRQALTVGEACSRPALTTSPRATLHDAAGELLAHGVSLLVVVDACRVTGMLTRRGVLKALTRRDAELRALVAAELKAAGGLEGVHAEVEWGVATVSGRARFRSDAERLYERLTGIDGIMAVYNRLAWDEDDLSLPPPMLI
jgi:CBS domain-containing protein